ncbi:TonB-dependent receptor plug domain-containing protein [Sphingomonas sp. MMS24-J13]|uniref:TonB-dependent receptor plug domain-containing protein n=1 Tax=Sphingomonas sp. MMS24-J13 TaxID=3238686 RepID=UPI00384ADB34
MTRLNMVSRGALTVALLGSASALWAADPAPTPAAADPAEAGSEIIVTGTRVSGFKASDSAAPIQVLGNDALKRVGQTDLVQALAQNIPSIQAQAFGNDQTAFHPSIKLRGLNPNHTLIMIDGKRRHGTANVVVTNAIWTGGAAPDIGLIPEDAIDHVEVLQDGAAAQYGTDAIAGVVNFILKKADHGGTVNATVGQYIDGDGLTYDIMGNIGLAPIEDMYLNLTAERKFHDYSFRGDVDPRVVDTGQSGSANTGNNGGRTILARYPGVKTIAHYPYVNQIFGDGKMTLTNGMYNWGYNGFSGLELYSFGTYSRRIGSTWQNYRLPNVVYGKSAAASVNTNTPTGDIPFPNGFTPREVLRETDYAATGGAKYTTGDFTLDGSLSYGKDLDAVYVEDSANAALYYDSSSYDPVTGASKAGYSPSNVLDGTFVNTQLVANLDATYKVNLGLYEPLNIAAGVEHRHETYELRAGDPASYYVGTGFLGGGIQSFFGYAPANASKNYRNNLSEYIDLSLKPIEGWLIDGAVRHEHYSDFGNTTVFKLTSRYDISPAIAVRGTVSTGFRAPTLAEGFYSGINVSVASLSGIFAPNSAGAKALGLSGLKPEKSTTFSGGLVLHPIDRMTVTIDAYQLKLRDRIVQSSGFTGYSNSCKYLPNGYTAGMDVQAAYAAYKGSCAGVISPAVLTALANNSVPIASVVQTINGGASGSLSINSFVNGVDSRTRGIDFLATYWTPIGKLGRIDWSLAANYNKTVLTKIGGPPSNINPAQGVVDKYAASNLTDTTPKIRATLSALWSIGIFEVTARESFYGKSGFLTTFPVTATDYYINVGSAFITDLEVAAKIGKGLRLSAGANNLFNKYPNKYPADFRTAQYNSSSTAYITKYPVTSPYGVMGGYYYGRVGLKF